MVPQGEVGLVFASVGLDTGVLSGENHSAVVITVILTTFVGPVLLNLVLKSNEKGHDCVAQTMLNID